MAYLPKSKYSVKNTPGGDLVYKSDSKTYIGDYMSLSTGKYYAGVNNIKLGKELVLKKEKSTINIKIFGSSKDVRKHKISKKGINDFLKNVKTIPEEKPYPTDEEYDKGFYKRYFAKRINGEIFIEINVDTFDALANKKPKYDYNLYQVGSLIWHLTGNVFLKNSISIRRTQKLFRSINFHFTMLDEYKLDENQLQTNLITNGGELYLANGKDYIGEYHIHESGPMIGPTHTEESHPKLYYTNKLPIPPNTTLEDFLASSPSTSKSVNAKPIKSKKLKLKPRGIKNIKKLTSKSIKRASTSTKRSGY